MTEQLPAVGRRTLLGISASAAGAIVLAACDRTRPKPSSGGPGTPAEEEVPVTAPEDLMREHGVLKRVLLIYQEGIRRLQAGEPSPAEALNAAAEVVRSFIEDYHARLEERYVFAKLEQAGKLTDLTGVLRTSTSAAGCSPTGCLPPPRRPPRRLSPREMPWRKTCRRSSGCMSPTRRAKTP